MIKAYLKIIYFIVIIISFFISVNVMFGATNKLYSGYMFFSRWATCDLNNIDYSTNKYCTNYYTDSNSEWLRVNKSERYTIVEQLGCYFSNDMLRKISYGDTVKLGIDKYGLFGVSAPLVPVNILKKEHYFLNEGGIIILTFCRADSLIEMRIKKY